MEEKPISPRAKMRTQLRDMKPSESLSFPIEKMAAVRCAASDLGAMMKRKYRTISDRTNDLIWVQRVC